MDVYLADLRRLAALVEGMPDTGLTCATVAGPLDAARRILPVASHMDIG